jgi:hypothetical protein
MENIFEIITIKPKPQRKPKLQKKADDPVIKNMLVNQAKKCSIYSESYLKKLSIRDLRHHIMNYKKRHFEDYDKDNYIIK